MGMTSAAWACLVVVASLALLPAPVSGAAPAVHLGERQGAAPLAVDDICARARPCADAARAAPVERRLVGAGWIAPEDGHAKRLTLRATTVVDASGAPRGLLRVTDEAGGFRFVGFRVDRLDTSPLGVTLEGRGVVQGLGLHHVALTAAEGHPDTVRLRIWDARTGAARVDTSDVLRVHGDLVR